jgi:chaperonin GroES
MTDTLYADDQTEATEPSHAQPSQARAPIHDELTTEQLATIGMEVVRDFNRDIASNLEWRTKAEEALKVAAQEDPVQKTYPFRRASNVKYPLLTISSMAFHSRAYPGIVKGDEAIKVKTFGKDVDGKKQARAQRMADYLNYLLFYKIEGWEEDTDSLLLCDCRSSASTSARSTSTRSAKRRSSRASQPFA